MSDSEKENKKEEKEIEFDIEIDPVTGEVLFTRDHVGVLEMAKEINPDDSGSFECFINDKPKDVDGNTNYKSFCG